MHSQLNGSALDPRDIHIPSQEPMVAAAQMPRAAAEVPDVVDDNRQEQLAQSAPALPLYLAEKYHWKRSAGGRYYLSPNPDFMEYVAGTRAAPGKSATNGAASRAADYGIGLIYPGGERDKTEEAALVASMIEESRNLLQSFRAMGENEGKAFERFLIERCTRNATYAATTQFEIENWALRAAERGQDASEHPNYAEKEARMERFALMAGMAYAVAREVSPEHAITAEEFNKAASRIIYENANFESDRLLTPAQLTQQQTAAAEATRKLARKF